MFAHADPMHLIHPILAGALKRPLVGPYRQMLRTWIASFKSEEPGYQPSLVRHDEIPALLARSDRELAAIGLRREEVEAYRDGRIKYLSRRLAAD